MRFAAKSDANQPAIVEALRKMGFSVVSLHRHGAGVPDLAIAKANRMAFCEVKMPGEELNGLQEAFVREWNSSIYVLSSVEDVAVLCEAWRLA